VASAEVPGDAVYQVSSGGHFNPVASYGGGAFSPCRMGLFSTL
jgi:hypothetical protein